MCTTHCASSKSVIEQTAFYAIRERFYTNAQYIQKEIQLWLIRSVEYYIVEIRLYIDSGYSIQLQKRSGIDIDDIIELCMEYGLFHYTKPQQNQHILFLNNSFFVCA